MPTFADIVIKKNDGTTDQTWSARVPSSGDRSPAIWRNESVGASPGHFPTFSVQARLNAQGTVRRIEANGVWNQVATDSTTGLVSVVNRMPISVSMALPLDMPYAAANGAPEGVAQFMNLLASALIKDVFKTGFAPT